MKIIKFPVRYLPKNLSKRDKKEQVKMLLQSKIQLFQSFIRTQPVNIRSFR